MQMRSYKMSGDTSINEIAVKSKKEGDRQEKESWIKRYYVWILVPLLFFFVIGSVEAFLVLTKVPTYIFPQPSLIFQGFLQEFSRTILPHLWLTLKEVLIGYVIGATIGIVLGAIVDQSKLVEAIITPYILILVTTPMVSLVPLLMLKFGFGIVTKVIAVTLASGPVIMMNTVGGLRRTSQVRLELMKTLHATTWQTFVKVKFPSALPSISTGLIVGAIFSIITAVGAEFVGGAEGLGNRILYFSQLIQTPKIYACIFTLSLMGITLYLIIYTITTKLTSWRE
jgi:NitT/TauT family transport system permease protein